MPHAIPFSDIPGVLNRLDGFMRAYPRAAMFELRERGFGGLFGQLVACVLSIRTMDEVSLPLSMALLGRASSPEALLALPEGELLALIETATYPGQKVQTLRTISRVLVEQYNGLPPADYDALVALPGIGPKCASLALGIGAGVPAISVDIHVHRVVNRWGTVATTTPERTQALLLANLLPAIWIDVNRLLMPFGKYVCKGPRPLCSQCLLRQECPKIGVTVHG